MNSKSSEYCLKSLKEGVKFISIAIIMFFSCFSLNGQNYDDVPRSRKKIVIDENFSNGMSLKYFTPKAKTAAQVSSAQQAAMGQALGVFGTAPTQSPSNTPVERSADNGIMHGSKIMLTSMPNSIPLDIGDCELEVIAKHEMTARSTFKIELREANASEWFVLQHINHNIILSMYRRGPDRSSSLGASNSKKIVKEDDFNKYTLRKSGDQLHVFINEVYAISLETKDFSFNQVDFLIYDTKATIDLISLYDIVAPGESRSDNAEFLFFD